MDKSLDANSCGVIRGLGANKFLNIGYLSARGSKLLIAQPGRHVCSRGHELPVPPPHPYERRVVRWLQRGQPTKTILLAIGRGLDEFLRLQVPMKENN
jgi:hypothetical protein